MEPLCVVLFSVLVSFSCSTAATLLTRAQGPDTCFPLVVAHRGASGYAPEHTLGAYALAITMGADYIEPDLVMTRDGHLIARHENELSLTTDVAQRSQFSSRFSFKNVDGATNSGWFSEDFTLAEIKTLRATELLSNVRPGNARMNGAFEIPTFQEIINLTKSMQISENRTIGIYPEIKHGLYFQRLGLAMERPIVETLRANGYTGQNASVYIQSFEVSNLKVLRNMTDLKLLQLLGGANRQPFDQAQLGTGLTYGQMATSAGLREIATYADGVGPDKSHIIPRTSDNRLGSPTAFVQNAHAAGLLVHPYTFRAENVYLPVEFRSASNSSDAIGNSTGEMLAFLAAGVDGLFTDQPDILVRIRGPCLTNTFSINGESQKCFFKPLLLCAIFIRYFSIHF